MLFFSLSLYLNNLCKIYIANTRYILHIVAPEKRNITKNQETGEPERLNRSFRFDE